MNKFNEMQELLMMLHKRYFEQMHWMNEKIDAINLSSFKELSIISLIKEINELLFHFDCELITASEAIAIIIESNKR